MSKKKIILAILFISLLLIISYISAVLFYNEDGSDEIYEMKVIEGPDGRDIWPVVDHSIFRGLEEDDILERISTAFKTPTLTEKKILYDHGFMKEVHYKFEGHSSMSVFYNRYEGRPHSHSISFRFGSNGPSINTTSPTDIHKKSISCWNWLFHDDIGSVSRINESITDTVFNELERINHTINAPIGVEIDHDVARWREIMEIPINKSEIKSVGFSSLKGKVCEKVIVNYSVTINSSTLYKFPQSDQYDIVTFNGTSSFKFIWYFDIETGKVLQWSEEYFRGSRGTNFNSNIGEKNKLWSDDYREKHTS